MNKLIEEGMMLPLSDLLLGQTVGKSLKYLMKSQYWTRKQIDDFQNQRLRKLIVQAYNYVPYYHDLFVGLDLRPEDISTKEDLRQIPILTKAIIKKEGIKRFTATNISHKQIINSSSSGSTGEPLHYLTTKEAYSFDKAALLRGWSEMGYSLGDRFVKISQNKRTIIKSIQDFITNDLYLSSNPLCNNTYKQILDKIESFKPKVIRCYPDPLAELAKYRLAHKDFYSFSPTAITTTGNTLFHDVRSLIEDAFGCPVFDSYSCEANSCTMECHSHSCYHCTDEYNISEVIDDYGNMVSKGSGHLILTDLWNYAHPFIRYDIQDIIEVDDSPCICGNQHFKITKIIGRDNDVIENNNGRKFIVHNFTVFFELDNAELNKSIEQFQIVQQRDKSLIIRVVVNDKYSRSVEEYIKNYWEKETLLPVSIQVLDSIPIMSNNKRRFIIKDNS